MSQTFSTKAGALDGLELGAPLSGSESTGVSHSTHTSGSTLPDSSQGVHHVGKFGLQDDSIGSSGSGLTEKVTHHHGHSGEHGHHHEKVGGLDPGVAAVMGPGHHDANPLSTGNTSSTTSSSAHPIADKYATTDFDKNVGVGAGLGAGAVGAGLGGAALRSDYHGDNTKTGPVGGNLSGHSSGLNEYSDKGLVTPAGVEGRSVSNTAVSGHNSSHGAGAGAGAAAGVAGATGVAAASTGHSTTGHSTTGHSTTSHSTSGASDPLADLKQELKDNQKSGTHSAHDIETKGPHGLVWSDKDDKYVHQRELDGHGSTGV